MELIHVYQREEWSWKGLPSVEIPDSCDNFRADEHWWLLRSKSTSWTCHLSFVQLTSVIHMSSERLKSGAASFYLLRALWVVEKNKEEEEEKRKEDLLGPTKESPG